MIHEIFPVGPLQCNCSIIADESTRDAMVIDPGDEIERVLEIVKQHGLSVKHIVVTHAHIDHTGYLPLLVKRGFRGAVHCTAATADLIEILFPDSARLQEEDAARANREGYTKHHPALPLYDLGDVKQALKLVERHPHVFGEVEARTAGRVRENWERIKREREGREGVFHHVPEALPALLYARKG